MLIMTIHVFFSAKVGFSDTQPSAQGSGAAIAATTTTTTTITGKQKQHAEDPTIAIVKSIYK